MPDIQEQFHGSDLEKIEAVYHIRKEEITSFSANVNPLGISPLLRTKLAENIDCITSYPDRNYTDLKAAIADYAGTRPENILVGNGTTELISLFIDIVSPKKAVILGPTYSEYERSVSLCGGKTSYYPLQEADDFRLDIKDFTKALTADTDLLIICSPNNPTGTAIRRSDMRRILDVCKEKAIFVMVDETYIEFSDDVEEFTAIPLTDYYNNLFVLRSTSKFFACPGLRFGYAVTGNRDMFSDVNRKKNPWMIHSLAAFAGQYMFRDEEYICATRSLISAERKRLFEMYSKSPRFKPYKPEGNFMLMRIEDEGTNAHALFEKAIKEKMMIRDCSSFPFLSDRYIRICFMNPADNDRLYRCLTEG